MLMLQVNNKRMAAFIDSGAQMTIMSSKSAEECNLLRLMDKHYHGIATGVGNAKILGRVHQVCTHPSFLSHTWLTPLTVFGKNHVDTCIAAVAEPGSRQVHSTNG